MRKIATKRVRRLARTLAASQGQRETPGYERWLARWLRRHYREGLAKAIRQAPRRRVWGELTAAGSFEVPKRPLWASTRRTPRPLTP